MVDFAIALQGSSIVNVKNDFRNTFLLPESVFRIDVLNEVNSLSLPDLLASLILLGP